MCQRLELWQAAKAVVRFPQVETPRRSVVSSPIPRQENHGDIIRYTPEMQEKYLTIPDY
jgi:hypothetical protein